MIIKSFFLGVLLIALSSNANCQRLNGFNIDTSKVTASGVASGGSVASQFHIAYSSLVSGVGIISGPPFYCAASSLTIATTTCMSSLVGPSVTGLTNKIDEYSNSNLIDNVSNLKNHRVYVYSGTKDTTVRPAIVKTNEQVYSKYLSSSSSIKGVYSYDSVSGMITNNFGASCSSSSSYHINNCDYNQAYDILSHLYPNDNIRAPEKTAQPQGTLQKFSQTEFFASSSAGLDDNGFVYIPPGCSSANKCKLHVVFHSCNQQIGKIDDVFAQNAGFNQVADLNNIIVLYPQAKLSLSNPNGCFDWWGYTNSNYATRNGLQLSSVKAMVNRLAQDDNVVVTTPQSTASTASTTTQAQQETTTTGGGSAWQSSSTTTGQSVSTTRAPTSNILDGLDIDTSRITVSGISSGGSMATQLHIAYSTIFSGVGLVAGPPYYCATGVMTNALTTCMSSTTGPSSATLINKIEDYKKKGEIDDTDNLKNHRVYIYAGKKDTTVNPAVAKVSEPVYAKYVAAGNIKTVYNYDSVHGMITNSYGSACGTTNTYYINNCDYDQAYDILNHVYPNDGIKQAAKGSKATGSLTEFSQTSFFPSGSSSKISMDNSGYLYVPTSCLTKKCKLHVALHGCVQQKEKIGNIYAVNAGYNQVADLNDIVVIYPQAKASSAQSNPNGCWDWWGYGDANYAIKKGIQMQAVVNMVKRIAKMN